MKHTDFPAPLDLTIQGAGFLQEAFSNYYQSEFTSSISKDDIAYLLTVL